MLSPISNYAPPPRPTNYHCQFFLQPANIFLVTTFLLEVESEDPDNHRRLLWGSLSRVDFHPPPFGAIFIKCHNTILNNDIHCNHAHCLVRRKYWVALQLPEKRDMICSVFANLINWIFQLKHLSSTLSFN